MVSFISISCASNESGKDSCNRAYALARMSHGTGRVAAKSSSIRRRREVKIRKSSYGPSSAVLLVVLAPVPISR